jgi:starch phosphorylase
MIMPNRPSSLICPDLSLTKLPPLHLDAKALTSDFRYYYTNHLGRDANCRSAQYAYTALALMLRDRLMERWKATRQSEEMNDSRTTFYLSLEFLMGRLLSNAMLNLGVTAEVKKGLNGFAIDIEDLVDSEPDAGLGNGGLGRLAACFLDSCATLRLPVLGYGLRYEYGMFRQTIVDGRQKEEPEHWLRQGNPWELERSEYSQRIKFGGRTESTRAPDGEISVRWIETNDIVAIPYDLPVPGFQNGIVNTLRLWEAEATEEFNLGDFNAGNYPEAVAQKNAAENITMVLYPNDASESGKLLRLKQQYFLASASLKDVLARWTGRHGQDFSKFAAKNCFQLNDTHPSCAVPELMRLLIDENGLDWDSAWAIVSKTMAYTNHTLLPEALERWPVALFGKLLPRLLEIIYEINSRFLVEVARNWPGDSERLRRLSIIEEGETPQVRMAYLAIVGSFSVNGVAALHSRLLIEGLFRDFYELWPEKFNNKTNGVTPRRWLAGCNPGLAGLITKTIGPDWVADLDKLKDLAPLADDPAFQKKWTAVKQENKERLATLVRQDCGILFDTNSLFDVQVKRIHEYKRQLLNVLHVIHLYDRIKRGDVTNWTPRSILIGGKAAPGYAIAKLIIKLVSNVAEVINSDPATAHRLKVAFLPNYRVSAMEIIAPGTDLSEQISTAGKEASGTGNMKFMMNGAITIGTLDGANIEIRDETGAENFFLFGLTASEVEATRPGYNPREIIAADENLSRVMQLLASGHFNHCEPGIFEPLLATLTNPNDPWLTLADFGGYVAAQQQVALAYLDRPHWTRMSILNSARSGHFSSDRTIAEYNREIWKLVPDVPGK